MASKNYPDIWAAIQTIPIPSVYGQWKTEQSLPYLVLVGAGSDNFAADNRVYFHDGLYRLEFYSATKDFASEKIIEEALDTAGVYWNKNEDVLIKEEAMIMVAYNI